MMKYWLNVSYMVRVDLCVSSFLKTCEEKKTFRTDCNGFKYKYVDFGRLL